MAHDTLPARQAATASADAAVTEERASESLPTRERVYCIRRLVKPRELAEESRKGRAMSGGIGEAWAELESLSSCFPSRTIVRRASARTLERFTIGRSKASQVRVQPGPRGCARPRSACCASRGGITWCSCARLRTAAHGCVRLRRARGARASFS